MGTQLKRVRLDFDWPIGKIWKGYINPYNSRECKSCGRTGYNAATKKIHDAWHDWKYQLTEIETKALLKAERLMMLTHIPGEGGWKVKEPQYIPTAEEVNQWYRAYSLGHDIVNQDICVKARAKHLGVYGACEHCIDGEIWESQEIKNLHDEWRRIDPPAGEGYQLWCTVKGGSPMTPVFATPDELCEYSEKESVPVIGATTLKKEKWIELFTSKDTIISL